MPGFDNEFGLDVPFELRQGKSGQWADFTDIIDFPSTLLKFMRKKTCTDYRF